MATGTYSLNDLLAVKNASAAEFGLDTINQVFQADLAYYNGLVNEQVGYFAERGTEQSRIYGTSGKIDMMEVDEFGAAPSGKLSTGVTVSFPLKLYKSSLGWTSKYLEIATPAELAAQFLQVRTGHNAAMTKEIKKAIYNKDNYTFVDRLVNGVSLGIKRFANADGSVLPSSPAGVTFDGATHTHYIGTSSGSFTNSDIDNLISTVTEHGMTRGLKLFINLADKAVITGLSNFKALALPYISYNATDATMQTIDNSDLENQMIGYWGNSGVEVWVKPYTVANYLLCVATEMPEKPLVLRERPQAGLQGLRIMAEYNAYPLVAQSMEAEFGFGVWNRVAGAVMYKSTVFANPTIA
jgi:hypothetical protein